MKYFIVEGNIIDAEKMTDGIMKEHMAYTGKAMEEGMYLMSGLKADMSGGIFIIKSESLESLENYLSKEPFKMNGIQDYRILEFNSHYFNPSADEWFSN
ncbi:YciI family protein [Clostridium sp. Marseille-P299]|uniref:YciI family protein n=1 Tax=Clostridium sp. Marseille-P299 TaxID=1805477 RepID=UPI00083511F3|nr:YciI family protein [Clostridium sp. Marseille-P299]